MKLCVISDSHDNAPLMLSAVRDAKSRGAEVVLHCGDVVAPSILKKLSGEGMPVHVIHGNNTGDLYYLSRLAHAPDSIFHYHGQDGGFTLDGCRVFLVHYPHYARALACTGDWDLVCCGHDHKAALSWQENMKGGKTLIVNPGTVGGIAAPATYALGDTSDLVFEILPVPTPA